MAGTREGGLKAAQTVKDRYGEDWYIKIGAMGGYTSRGGDFAHEGPGADGLTGSERARLVGHKRGVATRQPRLQKVTEKTAPKLVERVKGVFKWL